MTITHGDESVTMTTDDFNRMSALKGEQLGKQLKSEVNREMFPLNLKEYVNRIEKLSEEKKEIQNLIALVYEEAASKGFDKKALKDAIKMLKLEKGERDYHLELTSLYLDQIS